MSEVAIRATGLGKRYRLDMGGDGARYTWTLRESLGSWFGRQRLGASKDTLWALKGVSFEVRAGEVVGLIGDNGAGKSTLLKILSRITEPSEGEVELVGRVGSLLEVGTGFHPDLSGRENIYLNGAILGMSRAAIASVFDEIVDFAGLEPLLDVPVKRYSSGMYMRLAFAVAAHFDCDTLIMDEVLAVGDTAFQKKCLGKVSALAKDGRTVLFVSHNLGAVRSLCERALVLDDGMIRFDGSTSDAVSYYLAESGRTGHGQGQVRFAPDGLGFQDLKIHAVRTLDAHQEPRSIFAADEAIVVEVDYEVVSNLRGARAILTLSTQEGEIAFQSTDHDSRARDQAPGHYTTACVIPGGMLNRRGYHVEWSLEIPLHKTLAPRRRYLDFMVAGGGNHGSTFPEAWPGVVCPALRWETRPGAPPGQLVDLGERDHA